jgi:hypothetical protein
MGADDFGGGLWVLVVINSVIFIAFAASFFRPPSGHDWRATTASGTRSAWASSW